MMRRFQTMLLSTTASFVGLAALLPAPVFAQQTAQVLGLEEIVVTTRKREEKLLDIPIAITAFTSEDIQKAQLFDVRQIATQSPGLTFISVGSNSGGGRYSPMFIMRGMTYASPLPRNQTGAVFVDGIYVLGGITSVNTADVERVEVIKGPQNAYYGRNTFGGALNFITRTPGQDFKGEVSAEGSARGSYDFGASVEGPVIADKVAARVSLLKHRQAPTYKATDGGSLGEETTHSITGTIYATPSDNFSIRLRGSYQKDSDGPSTWGYLAGSKYGGNSCNGVTVSGQDDTGAIRKFAITQPYFCGHVPTLSELGEGVITSNTLINSRYFASIGQPDALRNALVNNSLNDPLVARAPKLDHFGMIRLTQRYSGVLQYEFPNEITATVNLAYDQTDTNLIVDADISDLENAYAEAPGLFHDYTAEARLQSGQKQRFRWLVGANYYAGSFDLHSNGSIQYRIRTTPTSPQLGFVPGTPVNRDGERAKVYAGFMSLEYDITDQLKLTGEVRYQVDKSLLQPSNPTSLTAKFKDWLPRVILNFKPTPEWTLYSSWARGALPGQFNSQYANATPFQQTYIRSILPNSQNILNSQRVDSFELGSKQQLFNNRLNYTLAGYYMKWKNLPSSSALPVPISETNPTPSAAFTGLLSSGNAKLHGIEFEATGILTDHWDVNFRANYQSGTYENYIQGLVSTSLVLGLRGFSGKHLARVPTYSGSLSSTYRDQLSGEWNWYVRGDVNYVGSAWDSEANIVRSDAYFRVQARLGVERGESLMIEVYAKNLLNDKHWNSINRQASFSEPGSLQKLVPGTTTFNFNNGLTVTAPEKREVGIRAKYKF